jgi:hypothetical protein
MAMAQANVVFPMAAMGLSFLPTLAWSLAGGLLAAALAWLAIDPAYVLPTLTKLLAGGTAMMGVFDEMLRSGQASAAMLNRSAGLLISPLDLPGVAVLFSAEPGVAAVWKVALAGALAGVALRLSALHPALADRPTPPHSAAMIRSANSSSWSGSAFTRPWAFRLTPSQRGRM